MKGRFCVSILSLLLLPALVLGGFISGTSAKEPQYGGTLRLLLRHILPNIMAPIIILFTTRIAAIILAEASLSFLGLGIPPPAPSWGGMLSGTGRQYMLIAPMMALIPGLALTIVVYGINVFGDAMRDLLDPRLRGGGGSYSVKRKREDRRSRNIKSLFSGERGGGN